jgi:hypothetical protein
MFTWICPQCGREVPPAYNDCPDCTAKTADVAPPQPLAGNLEDTATLSQPPLEFAPPPAFTPPPAVFRPAQPPPPPAYEPAHSQSPLFAAPPPPPPPKQRAGAMLPTWALAVLFAMAFLGVGLGVYAIATRNHASNREAAAATNVDSPAAKPGTKVNVLQKYIEVSGVRFSQDKQDKKVINVSIVLINHSDVDVDRLTGNVTVWGRTRNSEEDAVGTFAFMTSIAGTALKELVLPFNTKLKFIELPDWQNITVDVQITGPATY